MNHSLKIKSKYIGIGSIFSTFCFFNLGTNCYASSNLLPSVEFPNFHKYSIDWFNFNPHIPKIDELAPKNIFPLGINKIEFNSVLPKIPSIDLDNIFPQLPQIGMGKIASSSINRIDFNNWSPQIPSISQHINNLENIADRFNPNLDRLISLNPNILNLDSVLPKISPISEGTRLLKEQLEGINLENIFRNFWNTSKEKIASLNIDPINLDSVIPKVPTISTNTKLLKSKINSLNIDGLKLNKSYQKILSTSQETINLSKLLPELKYIKPLPLEVGLNKTIVTIPPIPKPKDISSVVTQATLNLVREFEGFRSRSYVDTDGTLVIGYGNSKVNGRRVYRGQYITQTQAELELQKQLKEIQKEVADNVNVKLNPNQLGAIASLTYNTGTGILKTSTLIKKLNSGDYAGAAKEFPRWNKAHIRGRLVALAGLTRRRYAEQKLFLTPHQ